jgi:hypothetical protein
VRGKGCRAFRRVRQVLTRAFGWRTIKGMLVDARWPPPEPEPDGPSFPWAIVRWPVLTVVLLAAVFLAPALIAYACLCGALYCAAESFMLLLGHGDGLREHKQ